MPSLLLLPINMARISKAFVWLLAVYIITVVILLSILRDSSKGELKNQDLTSELIKANNDTKPSEINGIDALNEDYNDGVNENDEVEKEDSVFRELEVPFVYEDEELPEAELNIRYGPGENGTAVELTDDIKRFMNNTDNTLRRNFHGFNTFISDLVSLQRKVRDRRPEGCKSIKYPSDMSPASVVIIFRDEWPSVVLRTVYSVLGASPPSLLKEIVLVDDGSVNQELKATIDVHVANVEKLRLVRNPKPLGLMLAREKGIEATTSEYFVVMDGHMEVGPGWLEPLIARLQEVPKALLCSHVGAVRQDTFEFSIGNIFDGQFPFFDTMTLNQLWAFYSPKFKAARNGSVSPMAMGTVQGMMAVMRKDFFLQLGGFDPGMIQWGSEQMELSIKVWMCGGRVEMIPCSKVAHMYRVTPWGKVNKTADFLVANSLRTAEVWLDDPYKSIVREVIGRHSQYDIGDLTDRKRIRQENNCKPFQYFIDMVKTFSDVYLLDKIKAKGELKNRYRNWCLASSKQKDKSYKLLLQACNNASKQYFIHTEKDQIRSVGGTLIRPIMKRATNASVPVEVMKSSSYKFIKEATWYYSKDETLFNVHTKKCLTVGKRNELTVQACDKSSKQKWIWQRL